MATKGKITELYDVPGLEAQHQKVIGMVEAYIKLINEAKPITVTLEGAEKTKDIIDGMNKMAGASKAVAEQTTAAVNEYGKLVDMAKQAAPTFDGQKKILDTLGGSLEQNIKLQVQYKTRLSEIRGDMKLLSKETNDLAKNSADYQNKVAALTKEELELKNASSELTATIKQQIKENQSAEGSMDQLQARVLQLQNAYEALSAEEREGSFGKALKASIDALEPAIKQQEAGIGKFQRNVGNYSSAIQVLSKAFDDVKKKMDDHSKSGRANDDVVEALSKEYALLERLLTSQENGFLTASAEIKENTKALQQMAAAGLEGTDAYNKLFAATSALKDETSDLKAALTNAAPDDVAFNAAADAARGLVGIYGLAQSATALFGVENEELQETMVKLQAAETALQSIEAIRAIFKKENAVMQVAEIARQKVIIAQTYLQSAAESKNIAVRWLAVGAQKALNAVMSLAGGPVLALIGVLALLLISLSAMASKAQTAKKSIEQLGGEFEAALDSMEKYNAEVKRNGNELIAAMEANFATEKDIRNQRVENLREQLRASLELERQYRQDFNENEKRIVEILKKSADDRTKAEEEEVEKRDEAHQKFRQIQQQRMDLASEIRIAIVENERETTEEAIKARQTDLESVNITTQTRAELLKAQVANDRLSYAERIKAAEDFQTLQEQIINRGARSQLLTPGLTPSERKKILTEQKNALVSNQREMNKQIEELNRESAERERQARFQIAQTEIEQRKARAEMIMANENYAFAERFAAAVDFQKAEEDLINGQKNLELSNEKLIATERKAIEDKANADILASRSALASKTQELTFAQLDIDLRRRTAASNEERDQAIVALNEQFNQGLISAKKYNDERLKLEKKFTIDSIQIAIDATQRKLHDLQKANFNTAEAEAELAELQKNLSDEVTQVRLDNLQKLKDAERQFASDVVNLIGTVISSGYDRQLNAIDAQIEANNERKEKDIEIATATIQNEQERADAIAEINIRNAELTEQLENKQKKIQVDRAQFEKMAGLFQIAVDTAQKVFSIKAQAALLLSNPLTAPYAPVALAQIPFVIGSGVFAAAAIASAPIPKYALGTEDAPGGWAIVGDGGKRERIIHPDGTTYISDDDPQLVYLPPHAKVKPDAEAYDRDSNEILRLGMLNSLQLPNAAGMTQDRLNEHLIAEYAKQTSRVVNAIASAPRPIIKNSWNGWTMGWEVGQNWNEYVKASI